MSAELKKLLLELLDKDEEFRYAVAGRLGLSEIMRKLDEYGRSMVRLWEEVRSLREGQNRLWEEVRALWEEVKSLREGQEKLWENQNRLWEEVRALREDQRRLWEEVRSLREAQEKLWENQRRLWEEVRALREGQEGLRDEMRIGFRSIARAVGRGLEDYTIAFVEVLLEKRGYPREKIRVGRRRVAYGGEEVEIDVFNEDPLVVGEVTTFVGTVEEAVNEVRKVARRVEIVQRALGRAVEFAFLAVANVSRDALERLEEEARRSGVELILGRVVDAQV